MKEIIEEFEDSLLSESKDNEDGLLVCEIDVFRKFAQQALTRQREEMIEIVERMKIITPDKKPYLTEEEVSGYNQAMNDFIKMLSK